MIAASATTAASAATTRCATCSSVGKMAVMLPPMVATRSGLGAPLFGSNVVTSAEDTPSTVSSAAMTSAT